ncbi:Hypothetical_protein [Hexamita inflata]|uniref:Hypothetical_protein n=1 Tax=Hexamita inflata TaxID=28002 RepID=A0ABP1J6F2_9EUKA
MNQLLHYLEKALYCHKICSVEDVQRYLSTILNASRVIFQCDCDSLEQLNAYLYSSVVQGASATDLILFMHTCEKSTQQLLITPDVQLFLQNLSSLQHLISAKPFELKYLSKVIFNIRMALILLLNNIQVQSIEDSQKQTMRELFQLLKENRNQIMFVTTEDIRIEIDPEPKQHVQEVKTVTQNEEKKTEHKKQEEVENKSNHIKITMDKIQVNVDFKKLLEMANKINKCLNIDEIIDKNLKYITAIKIQQIMKQGVEYECEYDVMADLFEKLFSKVLQKQLKMNKGPAVAALCYFFVVIEKQITTKLNGQQMPVAEQIIALFNQHQEAETAIVQQKINSIPVLDKSKPTQQSLFNQQLIYASSIYQRSVGFELRLQFKHGSNFKQYLSELPNIKGKEIIDLAFTFKQNSKLFQKYTEEQLVSAVLNANQSQSSTLNFNIDEYTHRIQQIVFISQDNVKKLKEKPDLQTLMQIFTPNFPQTHCYILQHQIVRNQVQNFKQTFVRTLNFFLYPSNQVLLSTAQLINYVLDKILIQDLTQTIDGLQVPKPEYILQEIQQLDISTIVNKEKLQNTLPEINTFSDKVLDTDLQYIEQFISYVEKEDLDILLEAVNMFLQKVGVSQLGWEGLTQLVGYCISNQGDETGGLQWITSK